MFSENVSWSNVQKIVIAWPFSCPSKTKRPFDSCLVCWCSDALRWPTKKLCSSLENFFSISLGSNSSMFANCLGFCDVLHVQSSVLGQNVMFGSVQSSALLLCDQSSLGTYSLMFANCSVFCDVQHVRSSILGQNVMFGQFDVRTFNVRSVRSSVFWCSFQD